MNLRSLLESRLVLWALASMSFACLLGHFYGWWSMRTFAVCILLPATLLLIAVGAKGTSPARRIVIEGAIAGVLAAIVYDLFRVPFVLAGKPLFAVFPRFGQMLLFGELNNDFGLWVQISGWAYHFINGASLGIMFLAMTPLQMKPSARIAAATAWAVGVEILLLLSPYYKFFQLKLPPDQFLWLTLSAHLVFGVALGYICAQRLRAKPLTLT